MLNGKFFTGLPPKMMDRSVADRRNRMESHLFWPDDTKVDTAVESRIKRRNSVQLASAGRPLYEKQHSTLEPDVDTKKRFSKEFSQSSIKFNDNLNEEHGNSRRQTLRYSEANKRLEITEKPTNTKVELPDNINNEVYTAAKKNQAYASKIEFYDYAHDTEGLQNNRNNLRKPKMDINDKREMDLNSKNSPKLQVKRDVRSLSEENDLPKVNNREVKTKERPSHFKNCDEKNIWQNRRSIERQVSVSPKRSLLKAANDLKQHYTRERKPEKGCQPAQHVFNTRSDYGRDLEQLNTLDDHLSYRSKRDESKKWVRNNIRRWNDTSEERDCTRNYLNEEDLRNRMQDVHLKSLPARKQYYKPEEHYDDEAHDCYGRTETPTNRDSSLHSLYYNYRNRDIIYDNLPHKNYGNSSNRLKKDSVTINKIYNKIQQAPVSGVTSPSHSDAESTVSTAKSQKHLRSSLCFNNGEIIGENDATASPTSTHFPTQRRHARNAATQRVSVGLPD